MTSNQLTRERLEKIKSWREIYGAGSNVMLPAEEAEELALMALAAMDSEPVAWLAIYHGEVYDEAIGITRSVVEAQADHFGWESALTEIIPLYRHAQPALVVPDEMSLEKVAEMTAARGAECSIRDGIIAARWWNACRAAMLATAQREVEP
ncbi:valyl-tRNA synthetase [Klebsiella oxytoca]|uniref:valyl-tRNA synthetase n=1 Tax=Klebsiella oxytoca TaxID=571 RepID=UPI001CCA7D15|nr:valyl-tRNA synthetase [Klebsiella oxytoca]UWC75965.1 valyl-tRNA synthetase [Klebsiella oxytoca]